MLNEKLSEVEKEIETLEDKIEESHITKDHINKLLLYVEKIVEHQN